MIIAIKNIIANCLIGQFHKAQMPKNDGVFKVRFHNTNLALKMPKWATKMLKLAKCCSIFCLPKYIFWHFNANVRALTKLTPAGPYVFQINASQIKSRLLLKHKIMLPTLASNNVTIKKIIPYKPWNICLSFLIFDILQLLSNFKFCSFVFCGS